MHFKHFICQRKVNEKLISQKDEVPKTKPAEKAETPKVQFNKINVKYIFYK